MAAGSGGPRNGKGTKSKLKIFVNIFVSFIGAGVLGLPYSFRQAGILEGCLVMGFVSFFAVKAMLLIIECKYTIIQQMVNEDGVKLISEEDADPFDSTLGISNGRSSNGLRTKSRRSDSLTDELDSLTYSELGFYAYGLCGQRLVDFSIVLSQVGFCCAYMIFITENLSSYFPWIDRQTWLFIMMPFLFFMTLYRELHKLAFTSLFAQVSNLLAFAVVFWFDFDHIRHLETMTQPTEVSIEGFPFFFAVAIYCYEGAGMILALEASVAKSIRHKFKFYFITTIIIVTALYITFGVSGYLSFGSKTNPIITLNLPTGGCYVLDEAGFCAAGTSGSGFDFAMLVKMCLCASLFFTYPVMMFPVTQLLEKSIFGNKTTTLKENGLRLLLVLLTVVIVNAIPSFANLMALIGATCCSLLAFILPGTFHLILHKSEEGKMLDYFLIFLGLLAGALGTMDTLQRLYSKQDVVAQAYHRGPLSNGTEPDEVFKEMANLTETVLETLGNDTRIQNVAKKVIQRVTTTAAPPILSASRPMLTTP